MVVGDSGGRGGGAGGVGYFRQRGSAGPLGGLDLRLRASCWRPLSLTRVGFILAEGLVVLVIVKRVQAVSGRPSLHLGATRLRSVTGWRCLRSRRRSGGGGAFTAFSFVDRQRQGAGVGGGFLRDLGVCPPSLRVGGACLVPPWRLGSRPFLPLSAALVPVVRGGSPGSRERASRSSPGDRTPRLRFGLSHVPLFLCGGELTWEGRWTRNQQGSWDCWGRPHQTGLKKRPRQL